MKALLSIVASAVMDAHQLRDTYRRSDRLAEEIWVIAFKRQMLKTHEPLLLQESPSELEIPPVEALMVTVV